MRNRYFKHKTLSKRQNSQAGLGLKVGMLEAVTGGGLAV